jgi:hypothetical protein
LKDTTSISEEASYSQPLLADFDRCRREQIAALAPLCVQGHEPLSRSTKPTEPSPLIKSLRGSTQVFRLTGVEVENFPSRGAYFSKSSRPPQLLLLPQFLLADSELCVQTLCLLSSLSYFSDLNGGFNAGVFWVIYPRTTLYSLVDYLIG